MMAISLVLVSFIDWSHEGHEFSGDDPVHIAIFHSLVKFVFFHIEGFELIPVELNGVLKALQDLKKGAFVAAIPL